MLFQLAQLRILLLSELDESKTPVPCIAKQIYSQMTTNATRHTRQSYLYIQELDAAIRNLCLNPDHSRVGVVLPRHLVIVKQLWRSLQLRATHCDKNYKSHQEAMRCSRRAVGQTTGSLSSPVKWRGFV